MAKSTAEPILEHLLIENLVAFYNVGDHGNRPPRRRRLERWPRYGAANAAKPSRSPRCTPATFAKSANWIRTIEGKKDMPTIVLFKEASRSDRSSGRPRSASPPQRFARLFRRRRPLRWDANRSFGRQARVRPRPDGCDVGKANQQKRMARRIVHQRLVQWLLRQRRQRALEVVRKRCEHDLDRTGLPVDGQSSCPTTAS
ncbi:MAG: hypothetical protein MZU97_24610 [Bacillus subtilis]|nr:hypothetical protein [Bacillus subtilis]